MQYFIRRIRATGYQRQYKETTVDMACLTLNEFVDIVKIVQVMTEKAQMSKRPKEDSSGAVMLSDFVSDLEISQLAGVRVTRRRAVTNPPFIAKMRQASKMAGCEDTLETLLKEVGPEGWQEEWSVPVESRMAAISSANLFNIDHMFILVMYCRVSKFAFSIFQDTFTTIFEDIFPLKEFLIKYKNRASYLTKGLKMSIKNKHILWDKYEKNPTTENKNTYTKFRNKLTGLMRKNERLHLENQLDLFQNEMGKSWKILRTVLCKNSKNKDPSKFNINNQEVMDCIRITTEFNTHFVETGPKLSEKNDSSVNTLKYVKCNKTHIKLPCISEDEISRTINSLKNASAGWDNIPTFVVKKVSKHIIRPLTYLINKSIEQGIFPDELNVAKVFPIYKSGDKKCISNYRPISVLSFFSKVFEKVMYNHLIDFIDDNNI